jgi:hypothetical protein
MTKIEIAANAIRGTRLSVRTHIDIVETLKALRMTSDEAFELRQAVAKEWREMDDMDSDLAEVLSLAKTVVNQYVRNPALH